MFRRCSQTLKKKKISTVLWESKQHWCVRNCFAEPGACRIVAGGGGGSESSLSDWWLRELERVSRAEEVSVSRSRSQLTAADPLQHPRTHNTGASYEDRIQPGSRSPSFSGKASWGLAAPWLALVAPAHLHSPL